MIVTLSFGILGKVNCLLHTLNHHEGTQRLRLPSPFREGPFRDDYLHDWLCRGGDFSAALSVKDSRYGSSHHGYYILYIVHDTFRMHYIYMYYL